MARWTDAFPARDNPGGVADSPNRVLSERILVLAPHMDDETLACGGTLLLHTSKKDIYCLFATDGAASPAPLLPWTGKVDPDLGNLRRREALAVAAKIGIPASNLAFLDLPDGALSSRRAELVAALGNAIAAIKPKFVFAPFRYDVHPDHTALNVAARTTLRAMTAAPTLLEYFVYHRLRYVPGGDVRRALDAAALMVVNTAPVAAAKRELLECYLSQTTALYPWQERPILTEESLRQRCAEPEFFLPADPAGPMSAGFASHRRQIQLACLATRFGKRPKDRALAFLRWIRTR
jgi:LmbE family N-acetylglucosaminyl deacetylase